jgi:polyhydroxybutyrate depolymerase
MTLRTAALALVCVALAASSGAASPRTITFPGIGARGVFDPSLEAAGDRIWMSYSAVEEPADTPCASTIERVETRLAYSDDHGSTWTDAGLVNAAQPLCLPAPASVGVRVNEVSTLVRDPAAPAAARWKLLWHHYLWVRDSRQGNRRFEHGWIGLREASTPGGLARAPERKLFVGSAYEAVDDPVAGPPLVRLDRLHSALAGCLAFTEPGALATRRGLYVALRCVSPRTQKLVLLERGARWRYVGTIADDLTAPELFLSKGRAYLIATALDAGRYDGCRLSSIDLSTGSLGRLLIEVSGTPGSFNGACGWEPTASSGGILLSEVRADGRFQIVRTTKGFASPLPPGTHEVELAFDGRDRSYLVTVPPQARSGRRLPLVLNFHGGGSDARAQRRYTRMDEVARREGFLVVYPSGTGRSRHNLTWNAGTCCGYAQLHEVDDVGFALAVLDDLDRRLAIDRRRVYATGISNGGMMAYRLAVEAARRIAAIAPVAGGMVVTDFEPARPVPVMHFHSVDDPRAPFEGGPGGHPGIVHPSIPGVVTRWARFDGCRSKPRVVRALRDGGQTATELRYGSCRAGSEVVLWKLTGAGHVWPGAAETAATRARLGPGTTLVDANDELWRFFSRHPLPPTDGGDSSGVAY